MRNLILLRPKVLAFKNSIERRNFFSTQNFRDGVLFLLALFVMVLIYRGTMWALLNINAQPELLYLSPHYPLGMILSLLIVMLMLSGVATAIGSLFLSDDLDLVLSTPLAPEKFFFNKLINVIVSSCWMPLIFLSPFLYAFGRAFQAPLQYYFLAWLLLFPFFVIPAAIAVVVALIITRIAPPSRAKEILFLAVLLFLTLVYFLVDLLRLGFASSQNTHDLMRLVSFLSLATVSWLPSNWTATNLEGLILKGTFTSAAHVVLLYFVALTAVSGAHLCIRFLHFDAYSRAKNTKRSRSGKSGFVSRLLQSAMPTKRPFAALIGKDVTSFSRDVTQMMQVVMLLGLCLIYIFNLRVFMTLDTIPTGTQDWWRSFFFISNCCMAAFVTTGFCTRFVYVSISLEGRSLWLLQSAPLDLKEIMHAKFSCWYIPVSTLTSVVFAAAALSTGVRTEMILSSVMISWIICYGIVGLAVGLGARFAYFNWEHTSQLAVGFGNMVFMLLSILLISFNVVPASLMLFSAPPQMIEGNPQLNSGIYCLLMFLVVLSINYTTKIVSLRLGEESLSRKLEEAV